MKWRKDEAPDAILNVYPILNTIAHDSMSRSVVGREYDIITLSVFFVCFTFFPSTLTLSLRNFSVSARGVVLLKVWNGHPLTSAY